jgi:hypothetical protein
MTEFDSWHGFHIIRFFVCSIIFECLYINPIVIGWCDAEASELILISGSVTSVSLIYCREFTVLQV